MSGLRLLSELLAATADAHSPRSLVRAIAQSLATRLPISRVELRSPLAMVELADGDWRPSDASNRRANVIAKDLAIVATGELPRYCESTEFREALGEVVASAVRHLETVQRVASVSRRAYAVNRELRADLGRLDPEIVARSAAMRAILKRAELVARHPTTVLVTGESGTGKEVLAREIHRRSPRTHRAMIQLNCGALPEALIESELFGHERGAFTGADRTHVGAFERADRGTLFLDEIGDLPLAAQAKLLRVLQERQVRRVGGESQIDVDVRLVAATNRDLSAMVAAGTFREDLFYRLAVFTLDLPPLRERAGDIAPLATALLRDLATRLDLPAPRLTRTTLARLEAHTWPGNVRELANVLESALILGSGESLELPDSLTPRAASPHLDNSIRIAIEAALRASRGKIYGEVGAAARLGLKPATLQSKMKKLGISRARFV